MAGMEIYFPKTKVLAISDAQVSVELAGKALKTVTHFSDLFRLCPQVNGCILFASPDARAVILHNDLLCNYTCSVTGGRITYWGGAQTEKIHFSNSVIKRDSDPSKAV